MKKLLLLLGLLVFVTSCFIAGSYTHGLVQHLLVIVPTIAVLKVACGKEAIKKNEDVTLKPTTPIELTFQLELEFEPKAVING